MGVIRDRLIAIEDLVDNAKTGIIDDLKRVDHELEIASPTGTLEVARESQKRVTSSVIQVAKDLKTLADEDPEIVGSNIFVGIALGLFGVLLGVLTVLCTATGITAALIGLLIPLIGTSLLTWFQPDKLPEKRLSTLAAGVAGLSIGCLLGMSVAFCQKFYDPLLDSEGRKKAIRAMNQREEAESLSAAARYRFQSAVYEKMVTDIAESKLSLPELAKLPGSVEVNPNSSKKDDQPQDGLRLFRLQASSMNELDTAIQKASEIFDGLNAAKSDDDRKKLIPKLGDCVTDLKTSAAKLRP